MLIIFYTMVIFSITLEEVWNIYHPRISPKKEYISLQWEKDDFYQKKIYGVWILKKSRITDNETKKYVRHLYWIQMVKKYPKLKKLP